MNPRAMDARADLDSVLAAAARTGRRSSFDVERVENLVKLAQIRGVTLERLMDDIDAKSNG
jgi:hypothetical protein